MAQLLRDGTANNRSIVVVVGSSLVGTEYVIVARCPIPFSFDIGKMAPSGNLGGKILEGIFKPNEICLVSLAEEEKKESRSQEGTGGRDIKMETLREKFREKLERAKMLRKKLGDPIALGRSIIEIPEDEADKTLDEIKGFKYVSKKA